MRVIFSSSAPISDVVMDYLRVCFGCLVSQLIHAVVIHFMNIVKLYQSMDYHQSMIIPFSSV